MRIFSLLVVYLVFTSQLAYGQQVLLSGLQQAVSIDATQTHLFIVEQGKHRILKLDFDGNVVDSLGGLGSGDYQFDSPVDIESSNGLRIYVSDKGNNRIQVYDRRFQFLSSIKAREGERDFEPEELVSTLFGEVLFYEARSRSIKVFDENGQERSRFILPGEVEQVNEIKLTDRRMYILDEKQQVIHELEPNGRYRNFYPAKDFVAFDPMKGTLIVSNGSEIKSVDGNDYFLESYSSPIQKVIYAEGHGIYGLSSSQLFLIKTP